MAETLIAFLVTVASVLLAPYLWIAIVMLVYGRNQRLLKDYSYKPSVSVVLPTYNEEKLIRQKLENLLNQDYPISEILVLDCSTDRTPDIVKEFEAKYGSVRLIRQPERIGNARTFNQAIEEAKGEIVIRTDCDAIYVSPTAIKESVANFADPKIGAVTGIYIAKKGIERHFRKIQSLLQVAETNLDSTIIAHAALIAFRKSVLSPIPPDSVADDTEPFVEVRKKGYRTIVDKTVVSIEEVPEGFKARRIQKDRRAHGILQTLIRHREMLFNRRYGKFGFLVLPQFLFIMTLSPVLLLAVFAILAYIIYVVSPSLLLLFLTGLLLSYVVRRDLYAAIIDAHISGLIGTLRMLRGKPDPVWRRVR